MDDTSTDQDQGQNHPRAAHDRTKMHVTEISKNSQILIETVDFNWTINKFDVLCDEQTTAFQTIRSPVITVSHALPPIQSPSTGPSTSTDKQTSSSSIWFFELRCNGGYLSLFLCNEEKPFATEEEKTRLADIRCNYQLIGNNDIVALEAAGEPCRPFSDETYAFVQQVQSIWKNSVMSEPEPTEHIQWLNFIYITELFRNKDKYFYDNDSLRFHMELKIPKIINSDEVEDRLPDEVFQNLALEAVEKVQDIAKSNLAQDIGALYLSLEHSDFTITCGNATFPVHKSVLIARCKKFYQMLMNQVNSKQTRILQNTDPVHTSTGNVSDMDPGILKAFLEYAYKGTVSTPLTSSSTCSTTTTASMTTTPSNVTSASKDLTFIEILLKQAIKYELEELKQLCFLRMIEVLDTENVAKVILVTELNGADGEIRDFVHKFCEKHRFSLLENDNFRACRNEYPTAFRFFDYMEQHRELEHFEQITQN